MAFGCVLLAACPQTPEPDGGRRDAGADAGAEDAGPLVRCEADLEPFLGEVVGSARVKELAAGDAVIGGPNAQARPGDFLLENERIRVVVQGPSRWFGPLPYGGTLLDADLVRPAGQPGNDHLGEVGLLYNFGRTVKPTRFEVLSDGRDGGAAVLAVTGDDAANDYLSIRNRLTESLGRVPLADPAVAVPLLITNYFVLNPGEQRVRYLTAFCHAGGTQVFGLAVGDLTDPGSVLEIFNPRSCTNGFGAGGVCFGLDRMNWFGYQGDGVAYGYAPYKTGSPTFPEPQNAVLTVAGITGTMLGLNGLTGLASWVQASSDLRDGELRMGPSGKALIARDFWVGTDLGQVGTLIEASRARLTRAQTGQLVGLVRSGGRPLPGARVAVESDVGRSVAVTGADGRYALTLEARAYRVSAWAPGREPTSQRAVTVGSTPATVDLDLVEPQRLTVTVQDGAGAPLPAKITVLCPNGPCVTPNRLLAPYKDVGKDPQPDHVQAITRAGADGRAVVDLPPGQYLVLVSRGPEYSIFPNDYPTSPGVTVDLRSQPQAIAATLVRVVDTTGWMSGDFHVHAVNSPDSITDNALRALGFAGDGIDILVSTDHDVVTDYGPVVRDAGLDPFLATVIGEEASPMEFGHYNFFPLTRDERDPVSAGAVDWANPDGLALSPAKIFQEARRKGARTVQFNHPRGALGGLTALRADTDTLATHVDPLALSIEPVPGTTLADTKLLSTGFDAFELLNPAEDDYDWVQARSRFNDWFTLMSRGVVVAGTGVSDTHTRALGSGWRTWVELGRDSPVGLDPVLLSDRLNARRAVASNGPFVKLEVYRVSTSGAQVTASVGIGGTVPPDSRELGVTVDVQVPQYLDVTSVDLYMHQPQDDARCPVDPLSPRATTTRVACDGVSNTNWPASSVAASQAVSLVPGDLETVATIAGVTYRRYHKRVTFRLPAPTTDNWLVAMVQGSRTLAPLSYVPPGFTGASSPTAPFAITNAVLIDADGNGYDHPPFVVPRSLPVAPRRPPELPKDTSVEAIRARWGSWFGHD